MIIRRIKVRSHGMCEDISLTLGDGINTVKSRHTDVIAHAVGCILNSSATPPPPYGVGMGAEVTATVSVGGAEYTVRAAFDGRKRNRLAAFNHDGEDVTEEYLYLSRRCVDEDFSEMFDGDKDGYQYALARYLDIDSTDRRELIQRSGGYSEIKAFRSYLWRFKKDFAPEPLREGKAYRITMREDGIYGVEGGGEDVFLSEAEKRTFRFLCFLRTAEFWHGFEKLRNMHTTKKPLVISNFIERLDESTDIRPLLDRAQKAERQVILLTR